MRPVRALRWFIRSAQRAVGSAHIGIVSSLGASSNLLFPPCCAFCGISLQGQTPNQGGALCKACTAFLVGSARTACRRCASPLPLEWRDSQRCPRCAERRYFFDRAVALGDYQSHLRQAVLWMKRYPYEPLTLAVGNLLGEHVVQELTSWRPNLVVPVPMHWSRRLKRGTNTARILGGAVAQRLALPFHTGALHCRRKSQKQGTLRPDERFRNVRGAFRVSSGYDITDRRVLLVDDILTTGATASEAARLLRQAGAAAVAVAVVARGTGRS